MRLSQLFRLLTRTPPPAAPSSAMESLVDLPSAMPTDSEAGPSSWALPSQLDRLELQAAIIHHLEWCVLFNQHLSVEEAHKAHLGTLPSASASGLGQWLSAIQGSPGGDHPRLAALAAEHQRFHQLAHQALLLARQGRMDIASTLLNTDFERSRARVLDLLRKMQKG